MTWMMGCCDCDVIAWCRVTDAMGRDGLQWGAMGRDGSRWVAMGARCRVTDVMVRDVVDHNMNYFSINNHIMM